MKISVLIPVKNDLRLKKCIDSVDEKVEVVISLNEPSWEIKKQVNFILKQKREENKYRNINFVVCEIKKPSIAQAYNNGIKNSSNNLILLMDSDCVFKKGTIKKLYNNLKLNLLSKGKVEFNRDSFLTTIIAKAREFHTSDIVSAYSPPLLFRKKIINHIGGYYFHPKLCWLEDNEFNKRVINAKLKIVYDPSANVYHATLSIFSDLKSAFWYGVGRRIGVEQNILDKPIGIIGSIDKYIIGASKVKGALIGIYLFIWKMSVLSGYYSQSLLRLRK